MFIALTEIIASSNEIISQYIVETFVTMYLEASRSTLLTKNMYLNCDVTTNEQISFIISLNDIT